MRSTFFILIVLGFFSLYSPALAQMNASAEGGTVTAAVVLFPDTTVEMDSSSGEPVPVIVHLVRALKLIPAGGKNTVALRTCTPLGCQPERDVAVGVGESIVKIDVELMNTRSAAAYPFLSANDAYFKSEQARFDIDGVMLPVLELHPRVAGDWLEQEPTFFIEPMKKIQQTFFVRVPKEVKSVTLVYGKDFSQPSAALQVCFDSCQVRPMAVKNAGAVTAPVTAVTPATESNGKVNGKSVPCEEVAQKVGAFAKMGLGIIIGLIVFGTLCTVFWVMMLVHAASIRSNIKPFGSWACLFFGLFVSIAYYFAVKRPFDAFQGTAVPTPPVYFRYSSYAAVSVSPFPPSSPL